MKSIFKLAICFLLCISSHFCFAQSPLNTDYGYQSFKFGDDISKFNPKAFIGSSDGEDLYNYYRRSNVFGFVPEDSVTLSFKNNKLNSVSFTILNLSQSDFQFLLNNIHQTYGKESISNVESFFTYTWFGQNIMFTMIFARDHNTKTFGGNLSWTRRF